MFARRLGLVLSLALAFAALGPGAPAVHADPAGWSIEPSPNSAPIPTDTIGSGTTCVTATDCWAVGWYVVGGTNQTMIQHWDGASWSLVASPNSGPTQMNLLRSVTCVTSSDCWAVGLQTNDQGILQTLTTRWDGSAWSIVPSPNTSADRSNSLSAVTCTSASACWAVGTAMSAGFVNQTLVMRWNGAAWSMVASPSSATNQPNYVNAVACVSASDCTAVGSRGASPSEQTLILRWNGAAWTIATSPNLGNGHNALYGVSCTGASNCWATGYGTIGNVQQTHIVRWDGTLWSTVLSPNAGTTTSTTLNGITCITASDCWSVGSSEPPAGQQAFIARWNGSSWSAVPAASIAGAHRLASVTCPSANDCHAVGARPLNGIQAALVERWNGSAWSAVTAASGLTPTQNTLLGTTCVTPTDCWAVGGYNTGTALQTKTQRWNGLAWTIVPSPNLSATNSSLYAIDCVTASDCWAVGFGAGLNAFQTMTMHWDGATWTLVPSPNATITQNHFLNDVTCVSTTDCWAVGFADAGGGFLTLILHWDGSSWSIVPSANMGTFQENRLYGVTCTATDDCWAVGRTVLPSGFIQNHIQRWDGTSWSLVLAPNTSETQANYLWSVACASAADCWSVGSYSYGSGTARTLILRWDGVSWSIAPSPNPTAQAFDYIYLRDVACPSTTACTAAGYYVENGVNRTLIERWDGASWSIVPTPNTSPTQSNFVFGIACPTAQVCAASGYYTNDNAVFQTMTLRYGEPPNEAPSAVLTASPGTGVAPLQVSLDASASSDPNVGDGIETYAFDAGDGSGAVAQGAPTRLHTYATPGIYAPSVSVTDRRGLSSVSPATASVVVRPPAPTITSPASGAWLTQTTVTIAGAAMPGTTVEITDNGASLGTTVADMSGAWSIARDLIDGAHAISARATHTSGTTSDASPVRSFSVDTTAPGAPTLSSPIDGATLTDSFVAFTGSAEPGSRVRLANGAAPLAETFATAGGTWSVAVGLANGAYEISATATDDVGNVSAPSAVRAFVVDDTTAPDAPAISSPAHGASVTLAIIEGSAEPGSQVTLSGAGAPVATTANAAGTWRAVLFGIPAGAHTISAVATDAAGNAGDASPPRSFTVVGGGATALTITGPSEGSLSAGQVAVTGIGAKPGTAVALYQGDARLGTVMAAANGTWSMGLRFGTGEHTLVATSAGVAPSAPRTFSVDADPPSVTTAAMPPLVLPTETVEITGSATDDHSVVAVWVTFFDAFNNQIAKVPAVCGCAPGARTVTWSVEPSLAPGRYTASAQSVDAVGNLSPIRSTTFISF